MAAGSGRKASTPAPRGRTKASASLPGGVAGGVARGLTPVKLTYYGRLPKIVNHHVHHMATNKLMKSARRTFGEVPPFMYPTTKAHVTITRVLGPGQRDMDDDSIAALVVGLRDALKPSYVVDDSPRWATFTYVNDKTRRGEGPYIEVVITYEEA